ncbi:PQQ-dependent sugar dehydrogenase [Pararoseomonas sp. SCSIO 73927]|uniref:PQQ-dependent sugar dehydrogenase n=1 Tax=Pararoseomonas sp. SCSIO 73927 TaxID=3114537 RepID=UPI0030D1DB06
MRTALLLLLGLAACASPVSSQEVVRSERAAFRVTDFATGLERPWGAAFLPDGRLLVTERPGRLRIVGRDGAVSAPVPGVPEVVAQGQGGLLDVALAPDFPATQQVYFCLAGAAGGGALTRLATARFSADMARLEGTTTLLDATPAQSSGRNHYGCRIVFAPDGKLMLSTGDRYTDKERAQRLDDLGGKVLRLERDGRPAEGNPFIGRAGARPEIFTYGHRNPQGLTINPATGSAIEIEFGARGGDEVNRLRAGANYGWPLVSYGTDYDGSPIGTGQASAPGIEEPLRHWTPAVSPSGGNFYAGGAFPGWRGNLFVSALRTPGLVRLTMDGDRVVGEERLLWGRTRLRHVLPGPDGLLYILTDETQGRVIRLEPAN